MLLLALCVHEQHALIAREVCESFTGRVKLEERNLQFIYLQVT